MIFLETQGEKCKTRPYTLHKILTKLNDTNSILFIFGHNPGFNDLAEMYVNFDENIPTCSIFEIEFNCENWSDIASSNAKFISFDYPKKV